MKKYRLLSLLLIISLFVCLLPVQAMALDDPQTTARSAVLIDADTGDILYQKNGDLTMFPGGLTMLMTALLVAEAIDVGSVNLADEVTASETFRYNVSPESITADPAVVPGEKLTVEELLYCSLLRSAADTCNMLAERVSGTVDAFVEAMNRRAQELGCTNTHFVNANGQAVAAGENHQTTAHDLALICRQLVTKPAILAVSRAASYTIGATEVAGSRTVYNANYLLDPTSEFYYQHAYGLKTGYSAALGNCLVAAADLNEVNVVAVILGCPENGDQFRDAITLFDWAFDNYSYRQILSPMDTLDTVEVSTGSPSSIGVRAETAVSLLLPNDQELGNVEYAIQYAHEQAGTELEAPISAGEYLGTVTVRVDGEDHGTVRLVAAGSSDISRLDYLQTQLKGMIQTPAVRQILSILVIIFGVYLLLTVIYFIQRLHHLHTLRRARKERAASRARQEAQWLDVPREDEEPAGYIGQPPARYDEPEEEEYEDDEPAEPDDRYGGRHAGGERRAVPQEDEEPEEEEPEDDEAPEEDAGPGEDPGADPVVSDDDIEDFFRDYKL